ncbi:Dcp1p-Dcp2p decapping enzyme complex alpha subunit [Coemansia thaxteri]|uniref:mRNA guanylyltransferase n=1 Tax=Coemansia thaxteri TaxID=2663907 RepID=A0A9W8BH41_9FUNG|nr:Dcp1p-Dcp2p decapping enzyme complex alpha subunit [Coemansia thaxteri]KAJ2007150.1 Dcp1p-Dcp2p decapping enzyme complex alpha subunit [Coemansia thaxteri]KAJ2472328.1 Dcp1p-Dcp2p decapping enzyme complex alpha subunit [Coemansia sp. RSA 2322]KAJ2476730.1 Dcp1p-Dcp2p decapping enzyme complex alpha subunit [Coemansia sp. RSA 2320]
MDDIPAIPGHLLPHASSQELRQFVGQLSGTQRPTFPGSQPVSFTKTGSIPALIQSNYLVCEKSDGVRVLVLMIVDQQTKQPRTYFITRKNEYYLAPPSCVFPQPVFDSNKVDASPSNFHHGTLIDAELVIDRDPRTGRADRKLLGFDALVVNGTNCMARGLEKRLGYLRDHIFAPFNAAIRRMPIKEQQRMAFTVAMKTFERSYGVAKVYDEIIPRLLHKSDGLIFTSVNQPYTPGTCEQIIKWKPASENSIDFRMRVITHPHGGVPDIRLLVWQGGDSYSEFGQLAIRPDDWHCGVFAALHDKLDGRIAETVYDPEYAPPAQWRFMRFRDDKPHGNHISVVHKIIESMRDNLELSELIACMPQIRAAWKQREQAALTNKHS